MKLLNEYWVQNKKHNKSIHADCQMLGVELRLGNAEHLPVADSSVDAVVAHMVLHHLEAPSAFFREAAGVCATGGVCVVADLAPHDNPALKTLHGDLWPGLEVEEVAIWMKEANFRIIDRLPAEDGKVFVLSGLLER